MPLHALRISRRIEVLILQRYLDVQPEDRLCDIGSGDGYWLEKIAKGARVTGIDIDWPSVTMAQAGHKRSNTAYTQSSATAMPFADGAFNKIYGVCSVEHIPDNTAAFREFGRCLEPGGVLALTLDSLSFPTITEEHRRNHHEKYFTPHLYNREIVQECLDDAGFQLTDDEFIISSKGSNALYLHIDRHPRLQYLFFPIAYPYVRISDRLFGSKDCGWKMAVRAVKI